MLIGKREKVEFAETVDEYSRRYKVKLPIETKILNNFIDVRSRKGI